MTDQSITHHPQTLPPLMANYIPPSVPPTYTLHQQQQQQQPLITPEQPSLVQYPPTAAPISSDGEAATTNFNAQQQQQQQQQQMAAMMQMQQQWAAAGFAAPYMMPYPPGMMMMPSSQAAMDRPASRQSSRPPSRQSVNAPVSSSRSMVNGQTGGQNQATAAVPGMVSNQGYPGFIPPGMYNPWFDPYWQSMYTSYQNPYSYGYSDEMMKYWRQMAQTEDDRYSHHSAAHSQSKQSQHSSSMHTWGSTDSLNDPYYQSHNPMANGYYPNKQQSNLNQSKRSTKPTTDPNTLLTTAPIPNQQISSSESKIKTTHAPQNGEGEEEGDDDDDDDDDDDGESSDDGSSSDDSSERFSIKSELAQVNEESSKARRTPLLYIRPHLRAKFVFDQLIQVLPQSPSDTNQPAIVEIISANSLHSIAPALVEERQFMSDFIGPLTSSTAKSNVIRYCERQSQLANKSHHIIDRDALSILWQYMALLVKTNGIIDVRVDIPKILWSSCNTPVIDETNSNSNQTSLSSITLENSLREFLALGEIDTSIKFACENQLYTHALIISYLTDKQLFEKTIHNIILNLDNGDVLKTFYELGAGSIPSVVSNVNKAHYGDWKRHLAVILANRTDTNAQFVDLCVKTMGDTLVSSGRIYAGHFCYLIANISIGSYRNNADKLAVIGSIHAGQTNLLFATIPNLQLTEVYEYALRKCLISFIPLKIYYTSKLIHHGLKREALAYCEEIGHTLIRQGNTSYVQLIDLQLFILIAEKSRAFSRNFQLDPTSYKEPSWLIELRRIIQNIIDNAFLNKTVRDDSINSSQLQPPPPPPPPPPPQQQQPTTHSTYSNQQQISNINQQLEQTVNTIPSIAVSYLTPNISNGYDTSNQHSTDQISYPNSTTTNYQSTLKVDTNVHYPSQVQSTYYPPPQPQQQQHPQPQTHYPTDPQQTEINNYSQPWSQQPTQLDLSNTLSQLPPTNTPFYQPPVSDQPSYIQPGLTSTPNPYSTQQPQQQPWYPPGQHEQRDRLPSSEQQQQQMESMRRRSSIITFDQSGTMSSTNWQQQSIIESRKLSSTSTQSNTSNNSPKTNTDTVNFVYQQPQLLRYPTNQTSSITEESQIQPQQTNGQPKKKHAIFEDDDDDFPKNSQKPTGNKSNTSASTAANQAAPGTQKGGLVKNLFDRFGWKRPTQAHLPDDKNRTIKVDPQTGRWIDTSKSEDEQASTQIKPPPVISSNNKPSSFVNNPPPSQQQQPPSSTFNPLMPPGSSQPRTLSFAAGSTTTTTSTAAPQTTPISYPPQPTTNTVPATTQPQTQPQQQPQQQQQQQQLQQQQQPQQQQQLQQQQPQQQQQQQQPQQQQQQQKPPGQLSAAQQRLQAMRQQQQQQAAAQQSQAPPATSSNQYSLKNRQTQSRYVDVLASNKTGVAPNPNISLNDLIPTPSAGMPAYASSNQTNNYFVPGSVQPTTSSHEQSSSSS